ncbi:hypothetical protein [Clostridium sp.]|uniref:hypothetical protein n=1 Tax=Clostridium sp. TaxID=1506 RepID=UPI001B716536|nr:hypothetical protein [Clostridium sp.]MBP3915001.1 hypothetical protein [Clostridium sp.]MEE0932945.1 hypothetical protein [Clostridium sp.]
MKKVEEVKRYGDLKKGNVYRRGLLEEYIEKYRCMLIEAGAKRGILAKDYTDNCIVKDIIENASGNFSVGKFVVSNKFFGQVIIVEKVDM